MPWRRCSGDGHIRAQSGSFSSESPSPTSQVPPLRWRCLCTCLRPERCNVIAGFPSMEDACRLRPGNLPWYNARPIQAVRWVSRSVRVLGERRKAWPRSSHATSFRRRLNPPSRSAKTMCHIIPSNCGAAIVYQMAILPPHRRASPGGRDDHRWWRRARIWRRITSCERPAPCRQGSVPSSSARSVDGSRCAAHASSIA